MAADGKDQLVQRLEIVVVARKENPIFLNGVAELGRIMPTSEADIRRQSNIMSGVAQPQSQGRACMVIIQVQSHGFP